MGFVVGAAPPPRLKGQSFPQMRALLAATEAPEGIMAKKTSGWGVATITLGLVGAGVAMGAMVQSMQPARDTVAAHLMEVDVSGLKPGEWLRVAWGKPEVDVFVVRRTPEQVRWLHDYHPEEPWYAVDRPDQVHAMQLQEAFRSVNPEYLVAAVMKQRDEALLLEYSGSSMHCEDFRYTPDRLPAGKHMEFPGGFYCAKWWGRVIQGPTENPWVYDPAGRPLSLWLSWLLVPPYTWEGNRVVLGQIGGSARGMFY